MILITGGAGYLGSHVSQMLAGHDILVYDNLTYRDEYLDPIRFVRGDVTDHEQLKKYLDEADTVIWLAAIVGDAACAINPGRATRTNVDAVKFLAENFDGKIIFTSSASVYGRYGEIATEKTVPNPQSIYAEQKLEAEELLEGKAVILRLGTLHGLSNRMRFDLAVNAMTRDAVMKGRVNVYGGEQGRPFLHVRDVAELIRDISVHSHPSYPIVDSGIYNVATENVTIKNVAHDVSVEVPCEINYQDSPHESKRDYHIDSSKIMKFNLIPLIMPHHICHSAKEIAIMLESGRIKNPYDPKYINVKVQQGRILG